MVAFPAVSPFKVQCGSASFACPICSTTFFFFSFLFFDRRGQHAPRGSSWPQRCSRKDSCAEVCHLFPPPPTIITCKAIRYFWMEGFWETEHLHSSHFLNHRQTLLRGGLETTIKSFCFLGLFNSASFLVLTPSMKKHEWYFLYFFLERRMLECFF